MPGRDHSRMHWDDSGLDAVEILRRAQALVASGWCQGADATDADDRAVQPWDPPARRWSLLGALVASLGSLRRLPENAELIAELRRALTALSETLDAWSLQDWNDAGERTQLEVCEVLAGAQGRCRRPEAH